MFDSLKKKFADASGKLRNKVEDEAKEENNVELIEEPIEETFDKIEESEEIEEFSDDEDISEEELDEMLDAALEEESEEELEDSKEDSDADKKEKSGFLGFLKRDKKEDSKEDSVEDLEEESEEETEEAAEEGEEYSQIDSVEDSEEEIPEDEVEEEKEEESKKSRRSLFRRKKKEESDESDDEGKKEKSGGFLSFIKEKSISEDDVEDILFELELGLLEADVAMDVSSVVVESVKNDLVGQKIKRSSDIEDYTYKALKNAVAKIIDIEGKSMTELLEEKVAQGEPLVVMLVGINGTGKTTTIGKLSNYYIKKGYTPVIAASDTFRAGAIEQVQYHADNLGVKLIKHEKGSDPAAVAFDAVQHARAKGKELVLIDTAGRMQTNTNLMDEMKKIRRVSKPDLVVFVGDALTGNDATEQARKFNEAIDIDGVILTKADADSKGGAALSIGYIIKKPILFLGMGQSYDDIKEYDADWMLEQIFS
ncbi:MAG: signal recognition particle-docking protein FtsY [Methanobrevibacter ruminantium]|uniref:signal recognition particle-docking protein FtsY n=1 Tax=Methanobrevibacter ruminantium TaxID=83816 RepID=UPI0026E960F5|nr:signal recognition particle-docking protein FtsY [Methanobrevibacter ruminantium]MCI5736498.1 signal recognition particle-docking protein FtsY [Methanobrevibacter ruminantium]MDD6048311.1 signal recognition particle-docking protein FtsY [Methanobrevibacter ruminantium]MDO5842732.1 signal recognition particle-docking protein FtsY [Methanobrevibacter ruminantium]